MSSGGAKHLGKQTLINTIKNYDSTWVKNILSVAKNYNHAEKQSLLNAEHARNAKRVRLLKRIKQKERKQQMARTEENNRQVFLIEEHPEPLAEEPPRASLDGKSSLMQTKEDIMKESKD